jgi:hypothetical protein
VGQGEEGFGGAVGGGGVGVVDLLAQGGECAVEEGAEAIGGGVEEFAAAAFEELPEARVVVTPAVEGFAIDAGGFGDLGEGAAGEEEVDDEELVGGELEFLGGGWWWWRGWGF